MNKKNCSLLPFKICTEVNIKSREYVFIPLTDVLLTIWLYSKQLSCVLFQIIQGQISILVGLYSHVELQLYSQVENEVSSF